MKKSFIRWVLSILHGLFLLVLSWIWLSSYLTYGEEFLLIKWSSTIKRVFLNIDEDPPRNRFLFVDLAYDKALIPREDGSGNEVITDRAKLARFFHIAGRRPNNAQFIFCDVLLQGVSKSDDSLEISVRKNKNVIFPLHRNNKGLLIKPDIDVPYAIADYESNKSTFLKFKLFQDDTINTVPVQMYKVLNEKTFSDGIFCKYDSGLPILNSIIIDFPIRGYELFDQHEYTIVNLSDLLILPEEVIVNKYLKGRIVVIGDFNSDTHQTIFGPMTGSQILLYAYLTLDAGNHRVPWTWFVFLIITYSLLSYRVFFADKPGNNLPTRPKKIVERYPFFLLLLGYLFILSLLSVLSYLIFGIHINILIIGLYLNICAFMRNKEKNISWWKLGKNWLIQIKNEYFKFF